MNDHPFPVASLAFNGGNNLEDFIMVVNGGHSRIDQVIAEPHSGSAQFFKIRCTGLGPLAIGGCFESGRTMYYSGVAATIFASSVGSVRFFLPDLSNRNVTVGDDNLGIPGFSQFQGPTVGSTTRTANLRAGVGGVQLKASGVGATVTGDPTRTVNLTGGADRDWFFAAAGDVLSDLIASEVVDVLP